MRFLILLLASAALMAQEQVSVLEDWLCVIPESITKSAASGQPTTVSCGAFGHGFDNMLAHANFTVLDGSNGVTVTIGSRTYRFVSSLAGCSANDVLSDGTQSANNAQRLAAAIMGADYGWYYDASIWKLKRSGASGDWYCAGTTEHPDVRAWTQYATSYASNKVYVFAKTPGATGEVAISRSGTTNAWNYMGQYPTQIPSSLRTPATLKRHWMIWPQSLGSDAWAGLFSATQPRIARVKSASEYEILYDSSGAGFTNLASGDILSRGLSLPRASALNKEMFQQSDEFPVVITYGNGSKQLYHPTCSTSNTAQECVPAFYSPDGQKGYGYTYFLSSTTAPSASTDVLTVKLNGVSVNTGSYTSLAADARVAIRGFQKYWNQATPTFADNGSGVTRVTTTSGHCVSGDQANFSGVSGAGAPDGAYAITYVSATEFDIPSKSYSAGWSGGVVACNAEGRARVPEAYYMARIDNGQDYRFYRVLTYNAGTQTATISVPGLPDGNYASISATTSTGQSTSTVYAFLKITQGGNVYQNVYTQMTAGATGATATGPDSAAVHVKNASGYNPNWTMLRSHVRWNKAMKSNSYANTHVGTYNRSDWEAYLGGTGYSNHFYLLLRHDVVPDRWMVFEHGSAINGVSCTNCWYNASPYYYGTAEGKWPGTKDLGAFSMMSQSSTFYWTEWNHWERSGGDVISGLDGATTSLGSVLLVTQPADYPNEWVRNRALVYSPQRWVAGTLTASPGYHFFWANSMWESGNQYRLRYHTASMRTNGWSAGTDGGTVTQSSDYTTRNEWLSSEMDEQADFYVAVRPVMPISGATPAGENIWFSVKNATNFQVGDSVTISGAGGNRDATTTVAEVHGHRYFWLDGMSDGTTGNPATWTANGGTLTNIVATDGTCVANFSVAHGLKPGMTIRVSGTTSSQIGGSYVSLGESRTGQRNITAADTNSITFSCVGATNGTYATSATSYRMVIHAYPAIRVAGTATGSWTGSGTIESQEDTANFVEMRYQAGGYTGEPLASPPTAPSALTATTTDATEITLGWTDNSADETSFDVQRRTGLGGEWATVQTASPDATSWVNTGLTGPQTYYFRVRACSGAGCSTWSNEASDAIAGTPVLAIETASLPPVAVGTSYSALLQASGGTAPYSWSITDGTCSWMSVSASSLVGTPAASGSCQVAVRVTDAVAATADRTYDVTITDRVVQIRSAKANGSLIVIVGGYAGMPYSSACTAYAKVGDDVVGQATVATGPATRQFVVQGTASTAHTVYLVCGGQESASVPITTGASAVGTAAITRKLAGGYTHAAIDYSADGSSWTSGDPVACSTGCTLSTPSLSRGVPYYVRIRRITSGSDRVVGPAEIVVP